MEDHSVGRLLRELPRETTRTGFTTRVLARLAVDSEPVTARPRDGWRSRLAFAAAAVLALVVSAGLLRFEQSREAARTAEARRALQEIRAEHERLEREVRALFDLGAEPQVIYLGGNEQIDLVLDLDKVPAADGPVAATYRPATF